MRDVGDDVDLGSCSNATSALILCKSVKPSTFYCGSRESLPIRIHMKYTRALRLTPMKRSVIEVLQFYFLLDSNSDT